MKRLLTYLTVLTAFGFGIAACKSEKIADQPEAIKPAETKPIKVLIQNSDTTSDCAVDGLLFVVYIGATENKWAAEQPDLIRGLFLESTNGITVVLENVDNAGDSKKQKKQETSETPQSKGCN